MGKVWIQEFILSGYWQSKREYYLNMNNVRTWIEYEQLEHEHCQNVNYVTWTLSQLEHYRIKTIWTWTKKISSQNVNTENVNTVRTWTLSECEHSQIVNCHNMNTLNMNTEYEHCQKVKPKEHEYWKNMNTVRIWTLSECEHRQNMNTIRTGTIQRWRQNINIIRTWTLLTTGAQSQLYISVH